MAPMVIDTRSAEDSRDVVHQAVQALAEGRLVAFPTETVYGVAASALQTEAVERLLEAKGREPGQPLTLAIKSAEEALDYLPNLSPLAQRLARRCWPGPLTLVAENGHADSLLQRLPSTVQDAVLSDGNLGLRVPGHPLLLDVLRMLTGPVALTSANKRGEPDAVTADEVIASLGDHLQLVLDDGRSRFGQPSSVVRVTDASFEVLREGVVSETNLRRLSSVLILLVCTGNTCRSPMAALWARKILADRFGTTADELEERGIVVASAGIAAMVGGRASPHSVEVMSDVGLDLSQHETQPLTEQLVRHADLILTMTRGHREAIFVQWPEAASRTQLLCNGERDVSDPIGGSKAEYEACSEQIRKELEKRLAEMNLELPQLD